MALTLALGERTRSAAPRLLPLATALVIVLVEYRFPTLVKPLVAVLLVAFLAWLARRHVAAATTVGLVLIGSLPVYAGRYVGGTQFGVTPALVVAIVLAPAALDSLPRLRVVPMDVAVAAYCLLRFVSTLLNFSNKIGSAFGPALYLASTYAVFRLLLLRPGMLKVATRAVVAVAAVAAVFAVFEHGGYGNIFFRLPRNGFQYAAFAQEQLRFGEVRAEASFGHSIALGMFLGLAMVLTVACALETQSFARRLLLSGAAGLILLGTLDTLSRGALLALALGLLLWFLRESRRLRPSMVLAFTVAVAAVVALTPVRSTVAELVSSSQSSTSNEALSNEHRFRILDLVTDPSEFSLLGQKSSGAGGVSSQVEERTGLNSFDNAYALVYLSHGLLGVGAFIVIGVLAFVIFAAKGQTPLERAWGAALCAAAVNLLTVNLLTQFQDFFWVAVAVAAGSWQRLRQERDARNRELTRTPG